MRTHLPAVILLALSATSTACIAEVGERPATPAPLLASAAHPDHGDAGASLRRTSALFYTVAAVGLAAGSIAIFDHQRFTGFDTSNQIMSWLTLATVTALPLTAAIHFQREADARDAELPAAGDSPPLVCTDHLRPLPCEHALVARP